MSLVSLTLTVTVKTTYRYKILMFMIRCIRSMRLIKFETAFGIVRATARRGWLSTYRIGNGKWKRTELDFDYEIVGDV